MSADAIGMRTDYCGELRPDDIGREVTLCGWVDRRREHGEHLAFIDLRDHTGIVQVVFRPEVDVEAHRLGDRLRSEYVIAVRGKVAHREEGNVNPKLPTGEVEILAAELEILNASKPPPFDWNEPVDERLRMVNRYYDLRRPVMQHNLRLRSKAARIVRDYFSDSGFVEIETPVLTRSTPEGARDYLVPSRVHPGQFYALPQSPQTYKQLIMIAGYDKYFQIGRCFRDEDLRGDRQHEFTQIEVEIACDGQDEAMERAGRRPQTS